MKNTEFIYGFVRGALATKVDKAGRPLYEHCYRVSESFNTDTRKRVALLHDVVEEGIPIEELEDICSSEEIEAIQALTRAEGESYMGYIKRCSVNPSAAQVKLVDLKDNMDITRLDKISDQDLSRLKMYHKAFKYLKAEAK